MIVIVFSCTIIEESDITTQQELQEHIQARRNSIQLKTIEITQRTGGTNATPSESKITATVVKRDTINLPTQDGTVTLEIEIDLPALGNAILTFKNDVTSAVRIREQFLSDGRPYTFKVLQNTTVLEFYQFRYDGQKRLNRILFSQNGQLVSDDTLAYQTDGKIVKITRRSPDLSKQGTISIDYFGEQENYRVRTITPSFQTYRYDDKTADSGCPGGLSLPSRCSALMRNSTQQASGSPVIKIAETHSDIGTELFSDIRLSDLTLAGGSSESLDFHPLMLLHNQFSAGNYLISIYAVDWWKTTEVTMGQGDVIFKYNYGL